MSKWFKQDNAKLKMKMKKLFIICKRSCCATAASLTAQETLMSVQQVGMLKNR